MSRTPDDRHRAPTDTEISLGDIAHTDLDPRLAQVLLGMAHGSTARQIADDLGLDLGTVQARGRVLRWTLGVPTGSPTVAHAHQLGYLRRGPAPDTRSTT